VQKLGVQREQCFFWATQTGAELDLFIHARRQRRGFEFKRTTTPKMTRSMHSAMEDLRLTRLDVIHAGKLHVSSRQDRASRCRQPPTRGSLKSFRPPR
jgi:predicted AAA+ superfamily ATPase